MLTSLVLTLKPKTDTTLPLSLGRAGHALLLRLIHQQQPALAEELHASNALRPFTCSTLIGGQRVERSLRLTAADRPWLRFTGLTAAVSDVLLHLAASPPPQVELDGVALAVDSATVDPEAHAWAGQISYQDFAAPFLLGQARPERKFSLQFVSPTTFRSQGLNIPLPLPDLVFGSLLNRWQAFAPVALSPDARRFAGEMLALSRYRLRSRSVPLKPGNLQTGFVGQATFTALNRDRYWLSVLGLLAEYSFYAGVGYQTAVGLGQYRPLRPGEA